MMTAKIPKMKAVCEIEVLNTTRLPCSKNVPPSDLHGLTHMWTMPEYLQTLMEGVVNDLTLRQREELAAAIYEFRDVFSRYKKYWSHHTHRHRGPATYPSAT